MSNNKIEFIDTSKEVKNTMVKLSKSALRASAKVAGKAINKWFYNNTQLYQADQLQEWQMPLFKELLEIVNRIVKSNA